jgi:hypothetical protein
VVASHSWISDFIWANGRRSQVPECRLRECTVLGHVVGIVEFVQDLSCGRVPDAPRRSADHRFSWSRLLPTIGSSALPGKTAVSSTTILKIVNVSLLVRGGGAWSLDALIGREV